MLRPFFCYVDDLVSHEIGDKKLYVLQDANWNVVALTDVDGAVVERYTYDGFGKRNALMNSGIDFDRAFTGQVLDAETGLMCYRNRYYSTSLGRFVTRDPIGYMAGDPNLYRYVKNASSLYLDPHGLDPFDNCYMITEAAGGQGHLQGQLAPRQLTRKEEEKENQIRAVAYKLSQLCTETLIASAPACTNYQCKEDAKEIARAYVEAYDRNWRATFPRVGRNDYRRGYLCYQWQMLTWNAIKHIVDRSKCFQCHRVGNVSDGELQHNWVSITVGPEFRRTTTNAPPISGSGIAWLDPWRKPNGPNVYLPNSDGDYEINGRTIPGSSANFYVHGIFGRNAETASPYDMRSSFGTLILPDGTTTNKVYNFTSNNDD